MTDYVVRLPKELIDAVSTYSYKDVVARSDNTFLVGQREKGLINGKGLGNSSGCGRLSFHRRVRRVKGCLVVKGGLVVLSSGKRRLDLIANT